MKGSLIFIVMFQLLICMIVAEVSNLKPENVCRLVKNNTFIADPNDCKRWTSCQNGKAHHEGKCEGNLLYDSPNMMCEVPYKVKCNLNVESICIGLTDVYKADPKDCTKYCYCLDGEAMCAKCPLGQIFDPINITCVFKPNSTCSTNSPCSLAPNGFIGDGKTCSGYQLCKDSRVISSGHCEGGRYYNPMTGMCDHPFNVNCSMTSPKINVSLEANNEVSTTPLPVVLTTAPPKNDEDLKSPCEKENHLYSDGESCNGYIECKTLHQVNPERKYCPSNQHFDEENQRCVNMEHYVCTLNRCDGASRKYIAVENSNCKKYYICMNGVKIGKKRCPSDYPYLDEQKGLCVRKPLDFEICL